MRLFGLFFCQADDGFVFLELEQFALKITKC